MRRHFLVLASAVIGALFVLLRQARAEPTVASGPLAFSGCDSSERREIARLVALDLASSAGPSRPEPGSIKLTCRGGRFDIAIARNASQALTRAIDLEQLPVRARSRIVAIAVVELLAADPAEIAPPNVSSPASTPDAPVAKAVPSAPPATRWRASHLAAVASGRLFLGAGATLLGAGLRAEVAPGALAMDVLAELGAHDVPQGRTRLMSLSSSLSAGWATAPGPATLRLAAGFRAGAVRLSGEPADPSRLSGRASWRGWGGPKLEANLGLSPSPATLVQLSAESGYTLFSVYSAGPGERDAALRGVWVGLQLGVGLSL